MTTVDVHQHLWPAELVEALRRRTAPPYLSGWTLYLDGEPPYEMRAADQDPAARAGADDSDLICLTLSSPLGIEALPPDEAGPVLDAWHDGVARLGGPFRGWASVSTHEPDPAGLSARFAAGFVGVQVPAGELATPGRLERTASVLRCAEAAGRPVLVHPGPVASDDEARPGWWPAVVDYPAQLQAAWWTWLSIGRSLLPDLRICFVAGAGLAPLLAERSVARGGPAVSSDPGRFVDTSSHGPRALRALVDALGVDALVFGSDRPYAEPTDPDLGTAVTAAVRSGNPARLLDGPTDGSAEEK